jgi:hypothetical protein
MAKVLDDDAAAFAAALERAKIEPGLKPNGREMVRALYIAHVDEQIRLSRAVAELGLTPRQFQERLAAAGKDLFSIVQRVQQTFVGRDEWEAAFPKLVERMTDFDAVQTGPLPQPRERRELALYTDKSQYRKNEIIKIFVEPTVDCRLTLLNIDHQGVSCLMFPHPEFKDEVIKAGSRFVYPPKGTVRADQPGEERFVALCNASTNAVAVEKRDTKEIDCSKGASDMNFQQALRESVVLDPKGDSTAAGTKEGGQVLRESISVQVIP